MENAAKGLFAARNQMIGLPSLELKQINIPRFGMFFALAAFNAEMFDSVTVKAHTVGQKVESKSFVVTHDGNTLCVENDGKKLEFEFLPGKYTGELPEWRCGSDFSYVFEALLGDNLRFAFGKCKFKMDSGLITPKQIAKSLVIQPEREILYKTVSIAHNNGVLAQEETVEASLLDLVLTSDGRQIVQHSISGRAVYVDISDNRPFMYVRDAVSRNLHS